MEQIAARDNIIRVDNIWNNLENVHPLCPTIFVRIRSITLNRHPTVLYQGQLVWKLDFWEREEDIGFVNPTPLIVRLPEGGLVSNFSMDITITPRDPDGLGALYHSIRNQVENNFIALGRFSKPRSFSYAEMAQHVNINGITYLISSNTESKHITSYMHQLVFGLDNYGNLILDSNGMFLSVEGSGAIHVPINFDYKGIDLLYRALRKLYIDTAITIKTVKDNQVIGNAY